MTAPNHTTEFQKFESLARRILTTPKADLMKHAPKKASKRGAKKRK